MESRLGQAMLDGAGHDFPLLSTPLDPLTAEPLLSQPQIRQRNHHVVLCADAG